MVTYLKEELVKLGTLKSSTRDGKLVVVSKDNKKALPACQIANCLQQALDDWHNTYPKLEKIYQNLNDGFVDGEIKVDENQFHSPLPRAYQWIDGSAFIEHIKLVRKARGAALPETLKTIPLLYQGGSDTFLTPREDIPLLDASYGLDFEGEVAVITDFVPRGITSDAALSHIKLLMLCNDVSLRGLIPQELSMGFGFFVSKPSSAFSPFAITPDELGDHWKNGRVHLPLETKYNDQSFGHPSGDEMFFHFGQLISRAATTRALSAGTIVGSGTFSNENPQKGSSCLAEQRMREKIQTEQIKTPFMKDGDILQIEMHTPDGQNLFGTILQKVKQT